MELFDLPARLSGDVHAAVFGALPTSIVRALDTPEVAAAVTDLLAVGWRPSEVGTRIFALPTGTEPAVEVLALLRTLRRQAPDSQGAAQNVTLPTVQQMEQPTGEQLTATPAVAEQPASPESRERWLTQIRQELRAPRRPRPAPPVRVRRPCAICGEPGELFVTRAVRLCVPCVAGLEAGLAVGLGTSLQVGQTRLEQAG